MEPLSSSYTDEELLSLIEWHTIDTYVGVIGTLLSLPTLIVFLSQRKFFTSNRLLTLLALGDFLTCVGIFCVGLMRKNMYTSAMESGRVPIESSWSCALKPFVMLRLLGSMIPPPCVLWIGIERFLAVFCPHHYRSHVANHTGIPPLIIIGYVMASVTTAYSLAWVHSERTDTSDTPFYCGRKASFSIGYTTYLYLADIFGYSVALILNCITLCKLARLYQRRRNRMEVHKQLKRIRYMLVISFVSTMTVAIPNSISLSSAYLGRLDIAISEPAVWMIAFKSSIGFIVYMLLKTDFRKRVYEILGCIAQESEEAPKHERVFDVSLLPPPPQSARRGNGRATTQMARPASTPPPPFSFGEGGVQVLRNSTRAAAASVMRRMSKGINSGSGSGGGGSKDSNKTSTAAAADNNLHPKPTLRRLSATELGSGT